MPVSNPYGDEPDRPGRIRAWAVIVGIVVGLVVTWVWVVVVLLVGYGTATSSDVSSNATGVVVVVLALAPFVGAILLLCFRRTRQLGAGLVMGVAIGTLVLAGVCGSLFIPGLTA
jgi:hypothetical protein